jgi:hypothetical protein
MKMRQQTTDATEMMDDGDDDGNDVTNNRQQKIDRTDERLKIDQCRK